MKFNCILIVVYLIGINHSCKDQAFKDTTLSSTAQGLLDDYNEFVDTLKSVHPTLYEFTSKEIFDKRVIQIRNQIDNTTTKRDLIWSLSEVIALIGCGHTSLGFFNQQRAMLLPNEYFPVLTRIIKDKLYVIDILGNRDKVDNGNEITHINGKSVDEIFEIIYAHISAQAQIRSVKSRMFNAYNTSYLPYACGFPESYKITLRNNSNEVILKSLKENPPDVPLFSKQHPCQDDFCLTKLSKETALLTIRNFAYYGERTKVYTDFIDSIFNEIRLKKYDNLIIDVRGNLGGPGAASIHLLKHTLSKPFYYFAKNGSDFGNKDLKTPFVNSFKGNIVFVMNGEGYSTVGHLASIYKDKDRVTFVGETLGSNHFCTANQKQFELTNTKIQYSVGRNTFITDVRQNDSGAAIKPDFEVVQSIDDFLEDKDVMLEKAIELLDIQNR